MRIALVYDVAYPFSHGGGEKRNWEIATRLVQRGHEVAVLTTRMWDGGPVYTVDGVQHVGLCPWRESMFDKGKRRFMEPLYFAVHLYRHLRRNTYDIVDCSNFPYLTCIAASIATKGTDTALVVTWFEARGRKRWREHRGLVKGSIAWFFEKAVARLQVTHVVISEFTRKRAAERLGLGESRVVQCGITGAQPISREDRGTDILYVGRLSHYKRVDMLIDAFGLIADEFSNAKLRIVGQGDADALKLRASQAGLGDRVVFAGSLTEAELADAYAGARLFVLPSEQEGFGIVVLEAMATGTPVVVREASDSAASDLVEDGKTGLLFGTVPELADRARHLLRDDSLWDSMSAAGRETVCQYDWSTSVVPSLEALYEEIAAD